MGSINTLRIYNKKKNKLLYFNLLKYNNLFLYFNKLINFFCNFFLSLNEFFSIFFYFLGYNKKSKNLEIDFIFNLKIFIDVKNKFLNTIFNRFINNYYSTDFFLKNSKVMALCASKQYLIF